ncbi:protein disabled isoform X4 [Cherax quadricarinatus]|uniref:protein disabled isoform X4 n=1 Tax=Cherax quadricarinatus TaxID=27406 RepID=UPI00387E6863
MSGSGTSGASASYNTIRRGIKATTSKLMGATSSVRRPSASPTSVADRQGGQEKNDPHRFVEGLSFKGKLIGVLEVSEARGDRMCQEALAELKMAVRAAGEHKQRIVINVAMDGIRLRDERSSDCLYHHPVHKISFIAQDMTDTRAFGYIFGSPDAGHKFFGIKTEKAASQVVIAMRDLFQVVFELKKKEIEKARSQLEEGRDRGEFRESEQFDPFGDSFKPTFPPPDTSKPRITASTAPTPAPLAPPPISGRTRHDSHHGAQQQQQATATGGAEQKSSQEFGKFPVTFPDVTKSPPPAQNEPARQVSQTGESQEDRYAAFKEFTNVNNGSFNDFSDARFCEGQESQVSGASSLHQTDEFDAQWSKAEFSDSSGPSGNKDAQYDVFTDLDPLGTGKNRPYIDKRDFFSDMRKPVGRPLREMGDGEASAPCSPRTQPGMIPPEVSALVASTSLYATTPRSICVTASRHSASTNITPVHGTSLSSHSFTESFSPPDSFGQEDFHFQQASEKDFYEASNFSSSGFADFNTFPNDSPRSQRSEVSSSIPDEPPPPLPCGPLTVALPPESFRDSPPPFSPPPVPRSPARMASGAGSPQLHHPHRSPIPRTRLSKHMIVATSSLSPKTLPRSHKFRKQSSFENEWDTRDMEHSQGFTSGELTPPTPPQMQSEGGLSPRPRPRSHLSKQLSASSATLSLRPSHGRYSDVEQFSSPEVESRPFPTDDLNLSYEEAPKPPPRPAHIEPPPLPPKRQPTHVTLRPPPRPPPTSDAHYNYINEYDSSPEEANTPPIPIPARKPRYPDSASQPAFIPSRCTKPHPDSFQFPKPSISPTHEFTGAVPKSSRESTPSKLSTPGKSPKLIQKSTVSVDLANTSLDQLAASLDMPVEQLARMTVVELAACLAQLQLRQGGDLEDQAKGDIQTYAGPPDKPTRRSRGLSRDQSKERFAFSEDEMFAEFDAQFPKSPVEPPEFSGSSDHVAHAVGAPVSEDRYAVFRELTTVTKQKSVFDENFLTPQNSMEEEVSEVSSGTFKANFDGELQHDSLEHKSSLSDDGDAVELEKDKDWHPPNHDLECVTVFRSPEISEYDNFEPAFDAKFDDDFSAATMSEKSLTPVNSPTHQRHTSPRPHRQQTDAQKSPFTDDFSTSIHTGGNLSKQTSGRRTRPESETSFASFDDNFVPLASEVEKYSNFQDLPSNERISRQDSLRSPFIDNFVDPKRMEQVDDSGFASSFGDTGDKFDDPFTTIESKPRSSSRSSIDTSRKTPIDRENALQPPTDTSVSKRKSPFDDDFTNRGDRYEVLKEVESEREPSLEGEVSRLTRQGDPRGSPFDDSWHGSHRNTPYDDQKSIGSLHSIHEEQRSLPHESPFDDDFNHDARKASVDHGRLSRSGSENRKSPFGDSFTPPTSARPHRSRGPSRLSVGSEGSDVRHSPFEDNFSSIIGSVAEEVNFDNAFPSLPQDITASSEAVESDPFSVKLSKVQDKVEGSESEMHFADFENAFQQTENEMSSEQPIQNQTFSTPGRTPVSSEDAVLDDVFPSEEPEFKVSARYVIPSSDMKKSESVNIFRRNSDPFADDFFSAENEIGDNAPSGKTDADPFWEEPFDNFSFPKEQ